MFLFFLVFIIPLIHAEDHCAAPELSVTLDTEAMCAAKTPGKVLQCIGSRLDQGLITLEMAEREVHELLKTFPSDHAYYSIGYNIGAKNSFIIGVQKHFNFDKAIHFRTNPLTATLSMHYYVHHEETTKPTLIFTPSSLELPEFPKAALSINVPEGAGRTKVVYRLRDEHREVMRQESDSCAAFAKWAQAHLFQDYTHAVVVLPVKFYCREIVHTNYDVVAGEFAIQQHEMGGNIESLLIPTWQITRHSKYGAVPESWVQDF